MRNRPHVVVPVVLTVALLAGCGGGDAQSSGSGEPVDGGTFTMALSADPGTLDPQASAGTANFTLGQFSYDRLLSVNPDSGEIQPELASDWKLEGKQVSLTLNEGITCSDGSPLTATDVADNLSYVADPANKSPMLGVFLPVASPPRPTTRPAR